MDKHLEFKLLKRRQIVKDSLTKLLASPMVDLMLYKTLIKALNHYNYELKNIRKKASNF